jgi:hypothetical protein
MDKTNPKVWIGLGCGIAVIGFLLLDHYTPRLGFIWNIMNGEVFGRDGLPYRYVLIGAVSCVLYGAYLSNNKQKYD